MSDVSISLSTVGKAAVLADFDALKKAGEQMTEQFREMGRHLGELFLSYEAVKKGVEMFHSALEAGDQVSRFSAQTGIAADKLVILSRAFENNGISSEELGKNINKMQAFIVQAGDEGSLAAQKLARIGMTTEELKGLSPDEQFRALSKSIASLADPNEKAAAALEIFGKAGGKLIPLLADMDASLEEAGKQVGTYAEILGRQGDLFDYLDDSLSAIGKKSTEFATGILDKVAPALAVLTESLEGVDAAKFGQALGDGLLSFIDIITGFFSQDWPAMLESVTTLVLAEWSAMGDGLVSAMVTAFEFVKNFFIAAFDVSFFSNFGKSFRDILFISMLEVESKILGIIDSVYRFFSQISGNSWKSMLSQVGGWIMDLFASMGEQLKQLLTHPLDYVRGKFNETFKGSADDFEAAYDKANGSVVAKLKAGVDSMIGNVKEDLGDALSKTGEGFVSSIKTATDQTHLFKSNIFDSVEKLNSAGETLDKLKGLGEGIRKTAEDESDAVQKAKEREHGGDAMRAAKESDGGGGGGGGSGPSEKPVYALVTPSGGIFNTAGLSDAAQKELSIASVKITRGAEARNFDNAIANANANGAGGAIAAAQFAILKQNAQNDAALSVLQAEAQNPNLSESDRQILTDNLTKIQGPSGEAGSGGSASGGKAADPMAGVMSLLGDISDMLSEHLGAIDEKLPLSALS
jgi:hypothetical protein